MGAFKSRQIGKYQIQAELGRGGFGSVYRAYDPTVGRLVAIKVLTASGDPQILNRFKNEAASAGNLRHKNILTIYDFGEHEGLPYIVMEFLEGEDLQQIINNNRPLPLLDKVSIMLQVADGLHCAHRSGVVHRDVKPANIRLLPDGTVKIMDFGIARMMAGSGGGARITRQGHVIGTLLYMAPEQVRGGEVDFLCDIFAYGITYYELLTGRHPFHGSDPRTVFYRITSEDPEPIRNIVPECPEALEAIVNRALQKERELRYQNLREVQLDSEPLLIELRQERAATLLGEATRLYSTGQLDSAQSVLNEAFDLDPGNRGARQLRETIQQQLLRRVIEPKIKALVEKGDALLNERRFPEAIEIFESALRLDRDNAAISQRLTRARELQNVSRETARLIADARREFSRNNLDAALQTLPEALELDPGNPEARQLFDEVRAELARREKAREAQSKLRQARDFLAANSFDESLRLLDDLDSDGPLGKEARELAAEIRTRKQAYQRQQAFQEELAVIRELMATAQQQNAITRLERLMAAYPEEAEATKLFILAHKRLAAQRKAEALERLGNELSALIEVHRYDRAIELVNDALRDYPAEQHLANALRDLEARREEHERTEAVRQALEAAQAAMSAGNPESAAGVLEAAVARFPREEQLTTALADARAAVQRKRRDHAIELLRADAAASAERADFAAAISAIEDGVRQYGPDPRLAGARDALLQAKAEWERENAIRGALDASRQSLATDDPENAVRVLEAATRQIADSDELSTALAHARQSFAAKQRQAVIDSALGQARALVQRRDYGGALSCLDAALARYHDERLSGTRDEVVSAKENWERSETIRIALEECEAAFQTGDPDRAVAALESALARYSGEARLSDALSRAREAARVQKREAAVAAACDAARALSQDRRFGDAIAELDRALSSVGDDPRLAALREEVLAEHADWERAEEIRGALDRASDRRAAGDLEGALAAVESSLGRYAGEKDLLDAATELRDAIEHQRRERAVDAAVGQASTSLAQRDFGAALTAVDRGVAEAGNDPRLTLLRDRAVREEAEWEKAERVRLAVADAEDRLTAGDPESAVTGLQAALARDPDDDRLQSAVAHARTALDALRRERTVESASAQAEAHLGAREFDHALDVVSGALAALGHDQRLEALKTRIVAERVTWHRAETLRKALDAAEASLDKDDAESAVRTLEAAEARYPGDPRVLEALAHASREAAVLNACREAEARLGSGEFDRAASVLNGCAEAHGNDARLRDSLQRVATAKATREREDFIQSALAEASRRISASDPDGALAALRAALEHYPGEDRLSSAAADAGQLADEKRRASAIAAACAAAAESSGRRDFDAALKQIAKAIEEHGPDPRLVELREQTQRAHTEWQREQEIRAAVQSVGERLGVGDPEAALRFLAAPMAAHPNERRLQDLFAAATQAAEAKECGRAVERTSREVEQLLERHEFDSALSQVEEALSARPGEGRLIALRERVLAVRDDWEAEQTVRRALSRAAELQAEEQFAEALQVLKDALGKRPSDPRLSTAYREIEADYRREQGREALEATVRDALSRVEQQPEIAAAALEAALSETPDDPRIGPALERARQLLAEREREQTVAAVCNETRVYLQGKDFNSALETLEQAIENLGEEERIARMRETVLASKADWERAEGIRRAVEEADRFAAEGKLDTAVESLMAATRAWGPEDRLTEAIAFTREAIEEQDRKESIEQACRQAESAIAANDLDGAGRILDAAEAAKGAADEYRPIRDRIAAERRSSEQRARQKRIDDVCRTAESAIAARDFESAVHVIDSAEQVEGAAPEFRALRERLLGEREKVERADAVRRAVEDAARVLDQGEPERAMALLDGAIARYGRDRQLTDARARAAREIEAKKKGAAVDAACRSIEAAIAAKDLKSARKHLQTARKTHGNDARFDELQRRLDNAKTAREPRLPPPRPIAPQPNRRVALYVAGAVVAALGVGLFLKNKIFTGADTGALEVHAAPANATVKVGDRTCTGGNCRFDLTPGVHRIEVFADGYAPETEEASLARGDSRKLSISLGPLPATFQVSANFAQGQVAFDGRSQALQDGQLNLSAVEPGRHEVRLAGPEGSASLVFESAAATLPALAGVTADGVEAVAVSTFGKQAAISCPTCSGTAWIDDQRVGEFQNGKLQVDSVAPGSHRLRLTGQSGERNLVFTAAGAPAVNFALTSSKNYGTLVIDTGEDGASVVVDRKRNAGRTVRGQLRLNVDAGEHTIRVMKNGYRVEPAELRAVVGRGDQFEARFRLTPEPAKLLITEALPGSSVRIDGASRGVVRPDGFFSVDLAPGQHGVELAKDGYSPVSTTVTFVPGAVVRLGKAQVQMTALPPSGAASRSAVATPPKEPATGSPTPAPAPPPDPAATEVAEWQRISRNPTGADIEEFLKKFPSGANAQEARRALERIDWAATNKSDRAAVQAFLSKHPSGALALQAGNELARLDAESAARLKQQQDADRVRGDRDQIRAVLRSYTDAYARKDVNQIVAVWPSMPARDQRDIRAAFRDFQSLKVDVQPLAEPEIAGATARVQCRRTTTAVDRNGPRATEGMVTIHLQKRDGRWLIDSIQ